MNEKYSNVSLFDFADQTLWGLGTKYAWCRMKELVEEVVEKVQLEVLNLSQGERQTILQSLYRIVWELKTHEIIGRG